MVPPDIPDPMDLGPDPEPLGSRFELLLGPPGPRRRPAGPPPPPLRVRRTGLFAFLVVRPGTREPEGFEPVGLRPAARR